MMRTTGTLRRFGRRATAVALACLLVGAIAQPAHPAGKRVEKLSQLDLKMPANASESYRAPNSGLIFDSPNRRAYQVILLQDFSVQLRAWNLDTRRLAVEKVVPPGTIGASPRATFGGGSTHWMHAVDHETGVLYLMYSEAGGNNFAGVVGIDGKTMNVVKRFPRSLVYTGIDPDQPGCTASACLPQVPTAIPNPRGMAFLPPLLSGGPRLLFFYQETVVPFTEQNFSLPFIEQWDAETGKSVYKYRVQACSNAQLPSKGSFQVPIFQARLTAGIYLVCDASGGTGQVVRINLDQSGQPTSEAAFPGPRSVIDALADVDEDRVLLRVANEEGDSWWAFDGTANSYTGVIGTVLQQVPTANGIDPVSGRLYTLAPPTRQGRLTSEGGLLLSDARRSPAPQALSFPEFASPGDGVIGVDVNPNTGERLVYARPGVTSKVYLVFRDNVDVSFDEPDSEQDSLTEDVDEAPGVTGANFAGSGHGYGFRTLLVGGINGIPLGGPDAGGIRIGRFAPAVVGSPCGPTQREFVIGAVRNAALSNSLAGASAAVADADSGTIQDIGEPSGRCYPRPTDLGGRDFWEAEQAGTGRSISETWESAVDEVDKVDHDLAERLRGYPRPLDTELDDSPRSEEGKNDVDDVAGSSWPFTPIECSGDGSDSTTTILKPLDRGDPDQEIPHPPGNDPRKVGLRMEHFNAEVDCEQSKTRTTASARLMLAEQKTRAYEQTRVPRIGTISVGDVSSTVTTYLDPERGLVTRSVAFARNIQIGDLVFIDEASTVAEAWAHGRPGTAATSFDRYLCGVNVRDQAPGRKVRRPVIEPNQNDPTKSVIEPQGGAEVSKGVDLQGCSNEKPVEGQPSVIDVINRALGSRARVSAPEPDGTLGQGTRGGYLASVQRDRFEAISSLTINSDGATQVPALELITFNDDPIKGRGRQLYQFAGVDASVTYGIYLLNPYEDLGNDDDFQEELVDFTGGPVYTPPVIQEPVAHTSPPGPLRVIYEGIRLLLRSPKEALLAAAVWLLFFAPVQVAGRRRALRALA